MSLHVTPDTGEEESTSAGPRKKTAAPPAAPNRPSTAGCIYMNSLTCGGECLCVCVCMQDAGCIFNMCVRELSGIQTWLLDGSNVSCSYFIRESGKLRVSTLAWDEPCAGSGSGHTSANTPAAVCVCVREGERKKEGSVRACTCKIKSVYQSGAEQR